MEKKPRYRGKNKIPNYKDKLVKNTHSPFIDWEQINAIIGCVKDIALEVNTTKKGKNFTPEKNCVYMPLHDYRGLLSSHNIGDLGKNYADYAQIIVNTDIILPRFLIYYLNSVEARVWRGVFSTGTNHPKLTKARLLRFPVPIPQMNDQEKLVKTLYQFELLKRKVKRLDPQDISLGSLVNKDKIEKINDILKVIDEISDPEKIRMLVEEDENINLEFKETFNLDIETKKPEKHLIDSSLKTVCGFFNSRGGNLLIGVSDSKEIKGVDYEIEKLFKNSNDNYYKKFKDTFKTRIGADHFPLIEYKLVKVDGKKVFWASCKPSDKEVFMDKVDFYVRTNPATDRLEGPEQLDYIRKRFGG